MTKQLRRTSAVTSKGMNGSTNQSAIPHTNGMIGVLLRKACEFNHVPDMTEGLRNSTMQLRKPSVNSVTRLNSTDLPPMLAIPCGRSAEFSGVPHLTDGLCNSTMRLRKPSVKSVTLLDPADLPPMLAIPCERSPGFNNVTDLTEGLRNSTMRLRKPSVKSVTLLNSANWSQCQRFHAEGLRNSTLLPV